MSKRSVFIEHSIAASKRWGVVTAALAIVLAAGPPTARAQTLGDATTWPTQAQVFPPVGTPSAGEYSWPMFHGGGAGPDSLLGWLLGTPTGLNGTNLTQIPSFKIGNWVPGQPPLSSAAANPLAPNHFRDGTPHTWSAPFTFDTVGGNTPITQDDNVAAQSGTWTAGAGNTASTATNGEYLVSAVSKPSNASLAWSFVVPTANAGLYSVVVHIPIAPTDTSGSPAVLSEQRISDAHYNIVYTDPSAVSHTKDVKLDQVNVADQQFLAGPLSVGGGTTVTVTLTNETHNPTAPNQVVVGDSVTLQPGTGGDVQSSPVSINKSSYPEVFANPNLTYVGVTPGSAKTPDAVPYKAVGYADAQHRIRQLVYFGRSESRSLSAGGFYNVGAVYCVDGFNGEVVWRFEAPQTSPSLLGSAPVLSTPAVARINVLTDPINFKYADKVVVIVADDNGRVYCLDAAGNGDGTSNSAVLDTNNQPNYDASVPATPHVGTTNAYWVYRPDGGTGLSGDIVDDSNTDATRYSAPGWTALVPAVDATGGTYSTASVPATPGPCPPATPASLTATWTLHVNGTGSYKLLAHLPSNPGTGYSQAHYTYSINGAAAVSVLVPQNVTGPVDLPIVSSVAITTGSTVVVTLDNLVDCAATPSDGTGIVIADSVSLVPVGGKVVDLNSDLPVPQAFGLASPLVDVDSTTHKGIVYVGNSNGVMYALDASGVPGDTSLATYGDSYNLALPLVLPAPAAPTNPATPKPLWWFSVRGADANNPKNPSQATIEGTPALYVDPGTSEHILFFGDSHEVEATSNMGRLYALDAVKGPLTALPAPCSNAGTQLTPGTTGYNTKQFPLWSFPNAYPGGTYPVRPPLGNMSGSPVVFTNPITGKTDVIIAANVGIEVPKSTTLSASPAPRPAADETGRIWAVHVNSGACGDFDWAFPNANNPNDAVASGSREPSDPIGAFLHATPAVGVVHFPSNIDFTGGIYTHADSQHPDIKGLPVSMLYIGTRGVNDSSLYALDLDGTDDASRFIYGVPSPSGAMFQSSPLLIVNQALPSLTSNTSPVAGNGGAVFITAGNTMYQYDATPISNLNSGQAYAFVMALPLYSGFGSISSFGAAAADDSDLGGNDLVTDWLYMGDSGTGFCRGITPGGGVGINGGSTGDTTGGNLPLPVDTAAPPPIAPQIPLHTWLFDDAHSTSHNPVADAIPGTTLAPYEWGDNIYIRISNVVPQNNGNADPTLRITDVTDPTGNTYFTNGSAISFQISQTDIGNPNSYNGGQDYRLIPATEILGDILPGDGITTRTGARLPDETMVNSAGKSWLAAFSYQIVPSPGQMNTPGTQRRVIGAQQTVERWKVGTPDTFVGSVVLQSNTSQGYQHQTNGVAGQTASLSQPTFSILNPLAVRGQIVPAYGGTPTPRQDVGPFNTGPVLGLTTGRGGTSYALRNGNEYYATTLPTGGSSGNFNPTAFSGATAPASDIGTTDVITTTGEIAHGSIGTNAELTSPGVMGGYTLNIADRSHLRAIGTTLPATMTAVPLHWNDNNASPGSKGEAARVNPLPWDDSPLKADYGANHSQDYPDIGADHVDYTVVYNGVTANATGRAANITPPGTVQSTPLPVKIAISMPKYQPANLQLFDPTSGLYGQGVVPTSTTPNPVAAMGYTATQLRVYVDSNRNQQWDTGEAYRDINLYTGVPVDMSTSFADSTIDIGKVPHGFGVQMNPSSFSPVPPIVPAFDPHFQKLTIFNDGNVNLMNVHLNQQILSTDGTSTFSRPMLLTSSPLDSGVSIPAFDYNDIAGMGTTSIVRSSLDSDWFATFQNPGISATYKGLTFHKARVTDSAPPQLTVPDAGRDPNSPFQPASVDSPKVSVAIPVGTPAGTYSTNYNDSFLNLYNIKLGLFEAFDHTPAAPYNPEIGPLYGGVPGGASGATNYYQNNVTYIPGIHTLSNPGTTLKVTVTEDRMTDGVSSAGTMTHVDSGPSVSGGASAADYLPGAFRDLYWTAPGSGGSRLTGSGNMGMYWTSDRNAGLLNVFGRLMTYAPNSTTKVGAFVTTGGNWWAPIGSGSTNPLLSSPVGPNIGMSIAQSQEVYDAPGGSGSGQFQSDGHAFGFFSNLTVAPAPYSNTLWCTPLTTGTGALTGTPLKVTPDVGAAKGGVRGLKIPLTPNMPSFEDPLSVPVTTFNRDLWAFWTAGAHGANGIHYSSTTTNSGALTNQFSATSAPITDPVTGTPGPGTDGILPLPAGLTAASDPSPALVFADEKPLGPQDGVAIPYIDVTYSGTGVDGNVDLYVSRYQPYHPQDPKQAAGIVDLNKTLLALVPSPAITETLQHVPNTPWWQARNVAWIRDKNKLQISVANAPVVLTDPAKLPTYDQGSGLWVFPKAILPSGALPAGATSATIYVDCARGRVRFSPALLSGIAVTAGFNAQARRITTDARQDTTPISFIDDTWKENEAGFNNSNLAAGSRVSRVQKSRYWFIWRKSGGTGSTAPATLYYKTQRLTVPLTVPPASGAVVPTAIGLDGTSKQPYQLTVTDTGSGIKLYDYNNPNNSSIDVDWTRGRIYFPMLWYGTTGTATPVPMEGRTVTVDWYNSAGTHYPASTVYTILWTDEPNFNNVQSPSVDPNASTNESAITIDTATNEGNPSAFLDPLAYANVHTGSWDIFDGSTAGVQQPPNIWLFWTSARNSAGGAANANSTDLYYETISPRFSAVTP